MVLRVAPLPFSWEVSYSFPGFALSLDNKGLAGQHWERTRVSGNRLLPRPPTRAPPPLALGSFLSSAGMNRANNLSLADSGFLDPDFSVFNRLTVLSATYVEKVSANNFFFFDSEKLKGQRSLGIRSLKVC